MERVTGIYSTICKTDSQWEFAVWLRELKRASETGWRVGLGRRSRREGTWVYLWLILVDVWQKTTKFCKEIILQLKKIKWQKKKKRIHVSTTFIRVLPSKMSYRFISMIWLKHKKILWWYDYIFLLA